MYTFSHSYSAKEELANLPRDYPGELAEKNDIIITEIKKNPLPKW